MFRIALSAFAALVLATANAAACIPSRPDPTTPLERIAAATNVFVGVLSPSENRPDALSVEVIASFKGNAAGTLDYGPRFSSCGAVGSASYGPYIFYEHNSARFFTPLMSPALAERFETVDGAIAAAEVYFSVTANSSETLDVMTSDTRGDMHSRSYALSGPPELTQRIVASLAASENGCLDGAIHIHPGLYIDLERGFWIDWGLSYARAREPKRDCQNPLVHKFADPRTHLVQVGLFKPKQNDTLSIAPDDWEWLGMASIVVD